MKQKLLILLFLGLLIVLLVGLNTVSYVQKPKTPDSESMPNRSTYNTGATGTQALFALLSETGRKVVRWQVPPSRLLADRETAPAVFVVIGTLRREFTDAEIEQLFRWVAAGGRLVLIDRDPPRTLVTTTANWQITFNTTDLFGMFNVDASDQKQMTAEAAAVRPVQPTVYTRGVNAVQPSRFASSISFERFSDGGNNGQHLDAPPPPPRVSHASASATPWVLKRLSADVVESPSQTAPVAHFASGGKDLLVDAPFGEGRIVYLADPYVVANGGIALADNAQLAINILSAGDRTIAFDEYHQGYGTDNDQFLQFFEGTPIVAIFLQGLVIVGFVFYSQSRRFARSVADPEPDRLSKLEYVSAMAELQERTHAFDLAIENIYFDFRRRASRLLGLDNFRSKYDELARIITERTGLEPREVSAILFKCEEIVRGEPTNKREVLDLISQLRVLEKKLGMTRSAKVRT